MFVAIDGKPAGLLGVADPIKATTTAAIDALHAAGIRVVMLTGDSRSAPRSAVARTLGIDEVHADVSPEDKHARRRAICRQRAAIVAMAGDGINDAPALAAGRRRHRDGHRHRRRDGKRRASRWSRATCAASSGAHA